MTKLIIAACEQLGYLKPRSRLRMYLDPPDCTLLEPKYPKLRTKGLYLRVVGLSW